jgi:hypothetical protein
MCWGILDAHQRHEPTRLWVMGGKLNGAAAARACIALFIISLPVLLGRGLGPLLRTQAGEATREREVNL